MLGRGPCRLSYSPPPSSDSEYDSDEVGSLSRVIGLNQAFIRLSNQPSFVFMHAIDATKNSQTLISINYGDLSSLTQRRFILRS